MAESTIASKVPWTSPATNVGKAISSLNAPARAAMVSVACLRGPGCEASPFAGAAGCAAGWVESDAEVRALRNPPRKSAGVPRLVAATRPSLVRRTSGGGGGSFISGGDPRDPVALLVDGAVAVQHQLSLGHN